MFSHMQQINRFIHQSMLVKAEKQVASMQSAWKDNVLAALSTRKSGPTETSVRKVYKIRAQQHFAGNRR